MAKYIPSYLSTNILLRFRSSKVLKAGSWYTLASIASRGIAFASIPLFTLLLTPEQYGTVGIFRSWMMIAQMVITLNLHAAVFNAQFDFEDDFDQFVSAILGLGILTSVFSVAILLILPTNRVFGLPVGLTVLALVGASSLLPIQIMMNVWQMRYQYRRYTALVLVQAIGTVLLSLGFIYLLPLLNGNDSRATGRILGLVLINVLLGIVITGRLIQRGKVLVDLKYWRYAIQLAVPLIGHSIATMIIARSDQILIDRFYGRTETGVYTLAYQYGEITFALWQTSNNVWIVWFLERMNNKSLLSIRQGATRYALGFAAMTALLVIVSPFVIGWLAPAGYDGAVSVTPVVLASGFLFVPYTLYYSVQYFEKRTGYIAAASATAAATNIGLNILFLPRLGYEFAAWTTYISYLVLFFVHVVGAVKLGYRELYNLKVLVTVSLLMAALAVLMSRLG